jgi:hypothetical protein
MIIFEFIFTGSAKPAAKADVRNAVLGINIMDLAGLRVERQESTILNITSIK